MITLEDDQSWIRTQNSQHFNLKNSNLHGSRKVSQIHSGNDLKLLQII